MPETENEAGSTGGRFRLRPSLPPSRLHAAGSAAVALVAGAFFATLSSHVLTSESVAAMDAAAFRVALAAHSPWLTGIATVVTTIGNTSVLTMLSILVGLWLARIGSRRRLVAFAATMIGGSLLNVLLKSSTERPRPTVFEPLVHASGFSFPSGHSMGSMLFFGSLGYVLAVTLETHPAWRISAVVLCLGAAVAIGLSRVYLGVHYLSDVAGGFSAGMCWIGVCIAATEGWMASRPRP